MVKSSKIVHSWFKKANENLIVAAGLLAMQTPQVWSAIGQLISLVPAKYSHLHELQIEASDLTPFAVEYRYPDAARGELTIEDITVALATARQVVSSLATSLNQNKSEDFL